jgi:hypothetical protein
VHGAKEQYKKTEQEFDEMFWRTFQPSSYTEQNTHGVSIRLPVVS